MPYRFRRIFPLVLCLNVTAPVHGQATAQGQPPAAELQHANDLFSKADWRGALEAYQKLAAAYPTHALSHFRVGVSLTELGRAAEAEPHIREGERLGMPAPQAAYRLAQALAEENKADAAIAELLRAAQAGLFAPVSAVQSNAHFSSLTRHEKWATVLDAFDAVVQPCRHDPRFREFDFWVGDWDVRPTGQPPNGPPARNTVTLDDNGCVVTEHWKAPSGSEGQSFNIFDRSYGLWRQTWVDNVGGQHDYRGALKNGNMVFAGDTPAPNGRPGRIPTRLTFFHISKDSVRQFSETSSDSGRTWQVSYDLMYVRRKDDSSGAAHSPAPGSSPAMTLSDADRAAIRRLDSTFVSGWLEDDTTAVLSVFSPDAVLLPPGAAPIAGLAAIRAYWWPADGSRTTITRFERALTEVQGSSPMAYARGTATLAWRTTKGGRTTSQTSRSTDLMVYAKDSSGRWRLTRQMWTVLP